MSVVLDKEIEEVKNEVHQRLMDEAYELWRGENEDLNYKKFLNLVKEKLGETHFFAVITGNMNYQVENGGFTQWFDNGYAEDTIEELIKFFENAFDGNDVIDKTIQVLREIQDQIEWVERGKDIIERQVNDYDYTDVFERALEDELNQNLERQDSYFYKFNEELMEILEEFFKSKLQ